MFLRQAREQGLRFSALIGHGAGYGVYDKLKESLGRDVNYFFNVDPISIWLTNEKSLRAPLPAMMRIYRDTRFSRDKTPYKTNVGIHFGLKAPRNFDAPGFYLHLEPGHVFMESMRRFGEDVIPKFR